MSEFVTTKELKELSAAVAVIQKYLGKEEVLMKLNFFGAGISIPAATLFFESIGEGQWVTHINIVHPAARRF